MSSKKGPDVSSCKRAEVEARLARSILLTMDELDMRHG